MVLSVGQRNFKSYHKMQIDRESVLLTVFMCPDEAVNPILKTPLYVELMIYITKKDVMVQEIKKKIKI